MNASLITFEGSQHTVVFNGDRCVDTTVVAAFAVGFVSLITPCVLPHVPGYQSAGKRHNQTDKK